MLQVESCHQLPFSDTRRIPSQGVWRRRVAAALQCQIPPIRARALPSTGRRMTPCCDLVRAPGSPFMANKMLIDASHPEETRVVVVRGSRVEEFDFESEHKKQLKGNIYLAKVTRVEPSLQAAFVEYGGNRHGFLAFSEIHPDYYQIPKADRQALIEEDLQRAMEEEEADEPKPTRSRRGSRSKSAAHSDETVSEKAEIDENGNEVGADAAQGDAHGDETEIHATESDDDHDADADADGVTTSGGDGEDEDNGSDRSSRGRRGGRGRRGRTRASGDDENNGDEDGDEEIDQIGSEDAMEEVPVRQARQRRQYKIQEVIKRRQILLVQVVKEERGNKGAALTTYLSLAGRYSVLMPNTARGGGISRKITNAADRKRLKDVVRELDVPRGMGIILRTAGANRTKPEVKRDYEYLMRLWETVRTVTLSSIAPALVYEEGSLIKRSIRDLYNKDIDQILVAGETGYREAKDFMRMLMPSQAKVVQPYRDPTPIFVRQGIESQLDKMVQPHVTLKSGGYIIINQTEALVAIDVNSGRSTKEHSIEDTAYQTNMEAAEEVARQLRLRDLAGLIVIDFIDMDEKRNNRAVEKKIKECLKSDRARIQVGSISHFGLLEMSRQRIRASVLESTMQTCPVCEGTGHIRSSSSSALHVLRTIEEHLQKHADHDLIVKVPTSTALYVLNEKRQRIEELEHHHGLRIILEADDSAGHQAITIAHGAEATKPEITVDSGQPDALAASDALDDAADEEAARRSADELDRIAEEKPAAEDKGRAERAEEDRNGSDNSEGGGRRRRRRRRKRSGDEDETVADGQSRDDRSDQDNGDDRDGDAEGDDETDGAHRSTSRTDDDSDRGRKRRRRGRRGGRRNREDQNGEGESGQQSGDVAADQAPDAQPMHATATTVMSDQVAATPAPVAEDAPVASPAEPVDAQSEAADNADTAVAAEPAMPALAAEPVATNAPAPVEAQPAAAEETAGAAANDDTPVAQEPSDPVVTSSTSNDADAKPEKPRRTGWWARRSFF
ncbi:ribonuclease, Rne/Rng domain protein [Aurantimonas manganoxydans SI85-9A1]|uniref:Ribonuclease E n=2 Tax=Aurantimonas manganoxydans TaxID=651183 RepID=Q1YNK2_AURMS|nr:ribonuclease, Rne/Rng domain protein [Aurantimonas manganoxydans SI85-9A1]